MIKVKLPNGIKPEMVLASIRERILFQKFQENYPDFVITHISKVEGFEKWDAVINSGGTQILVEVKVRDKKKDWSNWIIQEDKYEALTALTSSDKAILCNTKAIYINIFQNGAIIWDVNNEQRPDFFIRDSKSTTTFEVNKRKDKSVAYMQNEEGTIYNYENDMEAAKQEAKKIFKFMFPGILVPNTGIWVDK